ncbi:hypothetical protein [uncultured Gimesia sp.]|uniref:hypothetical protein n=1 Tax=uncultured Gimesia sp. TaxID=1678688 RepID=UPI0030D91795|tara:strand:- start:5548 stop:6156 length:609 start_codon:yes stop_codon:yes gene_type:complete
MKDDSNMPEENADENPKELKIVISHKVIVVGAVGFLCFIYLFTYLKTIRELLKDESTISLLLGIFLVSEVIQFLNLISIRLKLETYLKTNPVIQDQDSLQLWKNVVQSHHKWERVGLMLLFVLSLPIGILVGTNSGLMTVNAGIVGVLFLVHLVLIAWNSSSQEKMKKVECLDETAEAEYQRVCDEWEHKFFPDFKLEPLQE